jgi:hypothetical protein
MLYDIHLLLLIISKVNLTMNLSQLKVLKPKNVILCFVTRDIHTYISWITMENGKNKRIAL